MKYWLHRISHHAEVAYPLLDQNYLSIGFSDFSSAEFINGLSENSGLVFLDKRFKDKWDWLPKARFSLWRYIVEMKKGDRVIVPTNWKTFSVYEIMEDDAKPISEIELSDIKDWRGNNIVKKENLYYGEKGKLIDLGFLRSVKLLKKDIPRYDYADSALTAGMKIRSTNADISYLKSSIENALNGFEKMKPLNIYSSLINNTRKIILDTILNELPPNKFEFLVQWYFERIGATKVHIPAKNERGKDGDADIVAVFEPLKLIIYVQAKKHEGQTSSWAIEQIKGYKDQKDALDDGYSKIGWVISSGVDYSSEAIIRAKEANVQLINGDEFCGMLLDAGFMNLNSAF